MRPHRLIVIVPNKERLAMLTHLTLEDHGLTFCGYEIGRYPVYEALFDEAVIEPSCLVCIAESVRR